MAIQRHETTLRARLGHVRLAPGDLLLIFGPAEALSALADEPGLIPLTAVRNPVVDRPKAMVAVVILLGVVLAAGTGITSIMTAVLVGVILLIFTGCVRLTEIYEELDWMVVFLLAGLLPLGIAMEKTGAAEIVGDGVAGLAVGLAPMLVIGGIYLFASLLTEVMANIAAAVVMMPIALTVAEKLDMNPYALIVTIMFASSASFMTPIGYQTNTLIYGPGGYRFTDYLRVGLPLNLLLLIIAAVFIPLFWPS
jgi:di/tricarboxylate transporter